MKLNQKNLAIVVMGILAVILAAVAVVVGINLMNKTTDTTDPIKTPVSGTATQLEFDSVVKWDANDGMFFASIMSDSQGNMYVTGAAQGVVTLPNGSTAGPATGSSFLSKLNPTGSLQWTSVIAGVPDSTSSPNYVSIEPAVGASGKVHMVGSYNKSINFNYGGTSDIKNLVHTTFDKPGESFVSTRNASGGYLKTNVAGSVYSDNNEAVAVLPNGDYLVGAILAGNPNTQPWATPGEVNLNATAGPEVSAPPQDNTAYVVRYDQNDNYVSHAVLGNKARVVKMVSDSTGVYMISQINGPTDFDLGTGTNTVNPIDPAARSVVITKYDTSGNHVYSRVIGASGSLNYPSVSDAVDVKNGEIAIAGSMLGTVDLDPGTGTTNVTGSGFVAKYDAATGNLKWGYGTSYPLAAVALDSDGNVIYSGLSGGRSTPYDVDPTNGTENVTFSGGRNTALTKINSDGTYDWTSVFPNMEYVDLYINPSDRMFAVGVVTGTSDVDPSSATSNVTNTGSFNSEIFMVSYDVVDVNVAACGQACSASQPCDNGLQCSGGTCKLPACVSNPSSCNAQGCALQTATCGNGQVETGETCDGNTQSCTTGSPYNYAGTRACNSTCTGFVAACTSSLSCGDGIVSGNELCDGGALCSADCLVIGDPSPVCGDSNIDSGETCDDGNTTAGDGCSATCQTESTAPVCGNSILETGEQCDDGNTISGDNCSSTCQSEIVTQICGDGTVDQGEQCDDSNTTNGDGCSATCQTEQQSPVCGNNQVESGEQCDDGNTTNGDGCSATCQTESVTPVCGNGVREGSEQCDDGDTTSGDGCSATCQTESVTAVCGNGVREGSEQCDDGDTTSGDGCSATCQTESATAVCGNGVREGSEQCDDGDTTSGDGCSSTCQTESVTAVCGNGAREGSEQCDDGNTTNGDGCSSTCQLVTLPATAIISDEADRTLAAFFVIILGFLAVRFRLIQGLTGELFGVQEIDTKVQDNSFEEKVEDAIE